MRKARGVKTLLKVVTRLLGAMTVLKSSNVSGCAPRRSLKVDGAGSVIGPTPNGEIFAA